MKQKIYLETSVISYLAAKPSRDLIVAANQQMTEEWWDSYKDDYELYVSQIVIEEASGGDPEAAQRRLNLIENTPLLGMTEDILSLAKQFIESGLLPQKAARDALHIAIATIHGIDYLLTWNCKHIANATIRNDIAKICHLNGYEIPVICTPQELIGG
jgi:predicted nucleic acid-binding protein